MLTLGSLFDGSGGFPLAGVLNGIKPVWASEIEPFPIRVTKLRFPEMKHLGSVTDINGAEIEPVDIITFGSPCQDLSVAGKQKGIHEGERSNLFFEAIRIIKEMREHDRAIGRTDQSLRPRFAVWENVPGAFSSNKGADFQAVLRALCEISDPGADVPEPPRGGWKHAGCVVGDGYSIAWRVYDAQYWPGTPQRRKRIYLVADFGSERAPEILFERESVSGHPEQSGEAWQGTAADTEGGAGGSDRACGADLYNGNLTGNKAAPLCANSGASANHAVPSVIEQSASSNFEGGTDRQDRVICLNPWDCQRKRQYCVDGVYRTLDAGQSAGGKAHGICYPINTMVATRWNADDGRTCIGYGEDGDPQFTLQAAHEHGVCYSIEGHVIDRNSSQNGRGYAQGYAHTINEGQNLCTDTNKAFTIQAGRPDDHHVPGVAIGIDQQGGKGTANYEMGRMPTLCSDSHGTPHAVCFQQNQRDEVRDMGRQAGALTAEPGVHNQNYLCYSEQARALTPAVYDCRGNGCGSIVPNLTGDHENRVTDYTAICVGNGQLHQTDLGEQSGALNCMHDQQAVIYPGVGITSAVNQSNPQPGDPAPSVTTDSRNHLVREDKPRRKYIVRRLTPTECARLQGFPDWWCDGADGSDSAQYKMWGNGIALPCAVDVLRRIAKEAGGQSHD